MVRVHVGGLVFNNDAAEKLVVRLLLQATHAATSLYRQQVLKLLIMHAAVIYSAPLPHRALSRHPPRPPLISLALARAASYPYSVTTRCCVTPESPAVRTCQSCASELHLSFPMLLLLAPCFVEPAA